MRVRNKMLEIEKDEYIRELENMIQQLNSKIVLRNSIWQRFINEFINNKNREIEELIRDPVLTLPSGVQIRFNALSDEQLKYLESLVKKDNLKY